MTTPPSQLLGLTPGSYEAYCLDEAVIFFGMKVDHMLETAGHRPGKEEKKAQAAREQVISKIFGNDNDRGSGFADPALMFK